MRAITVMLGPNVSGVPAMDAYLSNNQNRANSFDPAPVLIAADNHDAAARARATAAAAGFRTSDQRERQASASALWVEFDRAIDANADALLECAAATAREGRYGAVLSITSDLLDSAGLSLFESGLDVIVDAGESDRAAALAIAVSGARR